MSENTLRELVDEKEAALRDALQLCLDTKASARGVTDMDVKRKFLDALRQDFTRMIMQQNGEPSHTTNTQRGAAMEAVANVIRELEGEINNTWVCPKCGSVNIDKYENGTDCGDCIGGMRELPITYRQWISSVY